MPVRPYHRVGDIGGLPWLDGGDRWMYVPDLVDAVAVSGTPPVQTGAGRYRFTIPGGASTAHPSAGIFAIWRLRDVFGDIPGVGSAPHGAVAWRMALKFITKPSLTSDSYVRIGFCDGPALTTSSYVGIADELQFTGGNEVVTNGFELYGSATPNRTTWGGPYSNAIGYISGAMGMVSPGDGYRPTTYAYTTAGLEPATNEVAVSVTNPPLDGASPKGAYIYLAAGRTAATAGDAIIEVEGRNVAAYMGPLTW